MAPVTQTPDTPASTPAQRALAAAVVEIERHVATGGWDGPVRVFALVRTQAALDAEPALASQLPPDVQAAAAADPDHLTSVEQEGLPASDDLEGLLGAIAWPEGVDGAALTVERIVLPPEAEEGLPEDPDAALAALLAHPQRQDVRLAVGVLRGGPSWCAVRQRAEDRDDAVGQGEDVVPGLVEGLRATFA
ncbi:PPA1309 family protein [Cellulomonas sp. Y8]|uniref:PPA1309 family protein n=1 Tax=Cellulomonas sp. Y8 TaxID=2591145 RepID=UPI003D731D1B